MATSAFAYRICGLVAAAQVMPKHKEEKLTSSLKRLFAAVMRNTTKARRVGDLTMKAVDVGSQGKSMVDRFNDLQHGRMQAGGKRWEGAFGSVFKGIASTLLPAHPISSSRVPGRVTSNYRTCCNCKLLDNRRVMDRYFVVPPCQSAVRTPLATRDDQLDPAIADLFIWRIT